VGALLQSWRVQLEGRARRPRRQLTPDYSDREYLTAATERRDGGGGGGGGSGECYGDGSEVEVTAGRRQGESCTGHDFCRNIIIFFSWVSQAPPVGALQFRLATVSFAVSLRRTHTFTFIKASIQALDLISIIPDVQSVLCSLQTHHAN
jgi:hypothetical protein